MEKRLNCPLCGKKDVVFINKATIETIGGSPSVLGSYKLEFKGGDYNLKHAKDCPCLMHAFDKEALLYFYLFNSAECYYSDAMSFMDYQRIFKEKSWNLKLESRMNKNKQVEFFVFIKHPSIPKVKILETTSSKSAEIVFDLFRHRLICGDIIKIGTKRFQFKRISLVEI